MFKILSDECKLQCAGEDSCMETTLKFIEIQNLYGFGCGGTIVSSMMFTLEHNILMHRAPEDQAIVGFLKKQIFSYRNNHNVTMNELVCLLHWQEQLR